MRPMARALMRDLAGAFIQPKSEIEGEREQKNIDERTLELAEQTPPDSDRLGLRQGIRAVLGETLPSLRLRKAPQFRVDVIGSHWSPSSVLSASPSMRINPSAGRAPEAVPSSQGLCHAMSRLGDVGHIERTLIERDVACVDPIGDEDLKGWEEPDDGTKRH